MKQEQVFGRLATAMPGDEQDGKVWRRHCAKIDHLSIDRQQTNITQKCDISIVNQDGKIWRRHCAKIDDLSIDHLDRQQTNTTQHCDISIWMERFGED